MHGSHLPLRTWFMAAHIVAIHSNGISALQVQAHVGIGSYKAAWLLLHKLRRAMVDPDRDLLQEIVEIDEAEMPFRRKADPVGRPAQEPESSRKIRVVGAVELSEDGHPRRIRLEQIFYRSSKTLHGFVGRMVEPGAHVITDGLISYENMPNNTHEPRVVSGQKAHEILHWVHRVFSNLKRWAKGVFHGFRQKHVQRYLDEVVFRWNRRRHLRTAFDRLLEIGVNLAPATYRDIVEHRA